MMAHKEFYDAKEKKYIIWVQNSCIKKILSNRKPSDSKSKIVFFKLSLFCKKKIGNTVQEEKKILAIVVWFVLFA